MVSQWTWNFVILGYQAPRILLSPPSFQHWSYRWMLLCPAYKCVLGNQLSPSRLCSKDFTQQAISQASPLLDLKTGWHSFQKIEHLTLISYYEVGTSRTLLASSHGGSFSQLCTSCKLTPNCPCHHPSRSVWVSWICIALLKPWHLCLHASISLTSPYVRSRLLFQVIESLFTPNYVKFIFP